MSLTEYLMQLLTSFDFWRFYCTVLIIVIAVHTVINLLVDNFVERTRNVHIFLFLIATGPMAFGCAGHYFNPFNSLNDGANSVDNAKVITQKVDNSTSKSPSPASKGTSASDTTAPKAPYIGVKADSVNSNTANQVTSDSTKTAKPSPIDSSSEADLLKEFRSAISE